MSEAREFSCRSARSGGLLAGILLVLVSEGIGIHLWVWSRNKSLALVISAMTLSAILWLIVDYVALGNRLIVVHPDRIDLKVGRRFSFDVPAGSIARVTRPTWRDLPEPGMPGSSDYLNVTKPATPNVLITLRNPVTVALPLKMRKAVMRIGMHVDDPDGFAGACSAIAQLAE